MEEQKQLTPMMAQYYSIKSQYKNEVLFYRLGDFYEMFGEDAAEVSKLLNLTLTSRAGNPMCGVPYHAAKIYIARLLRLGKKIVICEQVEETIGGKGIAERKVSEIITPGTAIESEYIEGNSNNFLASFCITNGRASFSYIDVTTSAFYATSWKASELADYFAKEVGRASPRELILPQSLRTNSIVQDFLLEHNNIAVSYYPDWDFNIETGYNKLKNQFKTVNLKSFNLTEKSVENATAGFLLDYLEKTTNTKIPHVSDIKIYHDEDFLIIDESSRKNLEIVANLRDNTSSYSLLECVNYGKTAMGNRKIKHWLLFPLTNKNIILSRQNHVCLFVNDDNLLFQIRQKLETILDIERLATRIAMDKAHAKDLLALKNSLQSWLSLQEKLSNYDFDLLNLENAKLIIDLISSSINEDAPVIITEGRVIKEGWSEELDHWRNVRDNFDQVLNNYEAEERERTGISTLKIKYNHAAGYFIEVSKGKLSSVPENFIMRRALVNGDRYTTQTLQNLEQELNHSGAKIIELERSLFIEIRRKLQEFVPYLLSASDEIAYIDAISAFAQAAVFNDWVCPEINESTDFFIEGGRHPIVEKYIPKGEFVPNDLNIGGSNLENPFFGLITGPNMAGKSTYLRQNALIIILAQIGSFVPAKKAVIGIVDKVFCRVGASDNLARGESTFLVEMSETANILRSATNKSFVIMDEVGRGTSTEDGLSIAWAVSEYLLNEVKARSLFATHYHELTRLEHKSLILLCMDVLESNGSVTFLRKVKFGAAENSYGIHVARLAGIPSSVIERAKNILEQIQNKAETNHVEINSVKESSPVQQVITAPGLFSDEEIILDEILSIEPDNITPLEALNRIISWKKSLSGR